MALQILPVSTLASYLQQLVATDDILSDMWVEGEITSITRARSGHLYFKLTEADAVIDGVMWRTSAARQSFVPQAGEAVVLHGHADFYPPQGRLQIQADVFERQGQGILALQAERLRQQLEAEGLFDLARKRPLPQFPRRVGVVTSSSGAVWHDIQTVARRRFPLVELVLVSASVQGADAPAQIVRAIRHLSDSHDIDVMIVGRGGGSAEDLAPFNDETVARAIFASHVPVVSAVGHETDISIADMVADVRAATPSAAAEIVLPDIREIFLQLDDFRSVHLTAMERKLSESSAEVARLSRRIALRSPEAEIYANQRRVDLICGQLQTLALSSISKQRERVHSWSQLLDALHPQHILERGYALVEDATAHSRIKSVGDLPPDGEVRVRFADGAATGSLFADNPPRRHAHPESDKT